MWIAVFACVAAAWTGPPVEAAERPVLGVGSHGDAVQDLQRILARLGETPGPADGWFGPATLAAVRRFQSEHGLPADGSVGPLTWAALAEAAGTNGSDTKSGGAGDTGADSQGAAGPAGATNTGGQGGDDKAVILTFDDGPSPWTAQLIDTLKDEHVPAVFFWNTYHIQFATDEVKRRLAEDDDIQIGDHTVDHADLIRLGYDAQYSEIADAKKTLEQVTGEPVVYFRPPYGDYNAVTRQVLTDAGMKMVLWDVDTLDWKYGSQEAPILRILRAEVHPGAIVLMHDHLATLHMLPDIIDTLRSLGYTFTSLPSARPSPRPARWHAI
ncbi:MAG: polysaccharide deacetylase family protein [Alicyclobacillus macrosporangiidus]|uniref:polysaccharide deacetylase family protein n=1 Tax=Alicyclobacillus macrosporangiidus TaxID=392015 RepID=UPI0026ED973A|nr:polysaccharide deacetylase family protein [Alicyclobacillus macrosporangiidus]MCL6598270.1 polysaccharide deacetylase family protein [Alicyclobacillus macrosporangiidus]